MSKFLYPIYKLKTKSYIKWWLYHKKAGGSGILSEILEGFSFNLENTLNRKFKLFENEGNSVQDGTPSPDNEVPIKSAGDNENIWNGEIERGAINGDGLDVDATNRVRNVGYYELNKGTYTLSYKGAEQSVVYIFNANKVKVNNPSWENRKSTFTLEENGYIKYALKQSDNREMNVNDVSKIKLEKGNKASGYSPYGMGSINEKIINKNVWNIDKFKNLYYSNSYETYNNVECLKLAGATQSYNFEGEENTQYTFQFKLIGSTLNDEIGAFSFVYSDGTSDYYDKILTPKTYIFTSKVNKTLVRIIWSGWSAGHFIYIDKNSMQLEQGSTATSYVEHEEQDYSIFVQQPMRSIGDVRDCFVEKSDGKLYERHLPYIASYNGETLPQDVYNEVDNVKYCNEKSMSTTGQFSIGASVQYIDENNWNDLPCTTEQVEQLENKPSTYKDFTIIQSEDETPAHLKIQYYKEG